MSKSKGTAREVELVNELHDAGFGVTRTPNSGGGTDRPLPDVIASNGERTYAIEAKARSDGRIYVTGDECEQLVYFARRFGAMARIGVRFDYEDWYFFHPGDLHVTDGGNFRIKKETALVAGVSVDQLSEGEDWVGLCEKR